MIVGIGLDQVEIARVARMIERHGARALDRLFTEGEQAYAAVRGEPARHLAARFAAKEAGYKALQGDAGARAIGWRDIEVVSAPDGRPSLQLHGLAAAVAARLGVTRAWVSLTHDVHTAAAVVVVEAGTPANSAGA